MILEHCEITNFEPYYKKNVVQLPLRTPERPPRLYTEMVYTFPTCGNQHYYVWPSRFNDHLVLTTRKMIVCHKVEAPSCALTLEEHLQGILIVRRNNEGLLKFRESLRKANTFGIPGVAGAFTHTPKRKGWLGPHAIQPILYIVPLYHNNNQNQSVEIQDTI